MPERKMSPYEVFRWVDEHKVLVSRAWHTAKAMATNKLERINQTARWLVQENPELTGCFMSVREWLIHNLAGY